MRIDIVRTKKVDFNPHERSRLLIIDSSSIGMDSARTAMSVSREALTINTGNSPVLETSFADAVAAVSDTKDTTIISPDEKKEDATSGLGDAIASMRAVTSARLNDLWEQNFKNEIKNQTLNYLLRLIYGEELPPEVENRLNNCVVSNDSSSSVGSLYSNSTGLVQSVTLYQYTYETETTSFSTTGTVNTSDGRSINFNIDMEMSRSLLECTGMVQNFNLMDPLVINLDGNPTGVSDQKFFFDLDCDGTEEQVSGLTSGSGFLALDINGDGTINDGSELFGTESGDGFKDLMKYDGDGNGWIDEADEIFDKLKIWTMDDSGNMQLLRLKEAGVGALYLGKNSTEFSLKDAAGATDAVIRSTGLFLFEDGLAGTLQQVDMAVS